MNKFKGSFYGFVVGDALGIPAEFEKRERLFEKPITSMQKSTSYDVPAGSWSDDSSMVLATMDSIMEKGKIDIDDLASKFYQWISYAKYTPTDMVFDIGKTTLKAITRYKQGISARESGLESVNDNGNGSLMRMMPVAFYLKKINAQEDEIIDTVFEVSSITHRHEISCLGCYIFIRYMMFLLDGYDRYESYIKVQNLNYSYFDTTEYDRFLNDDITKYDVEEISSSGYIVHTLEAVIWCINNTNSFKEALIGAVNLGDDADTIGALTGSIAGIIYGYGSIPKNWLHALQKREYLKTIMTSFTKNLNNLSVK